MQFILIVVLALIGMWLGDDSGEILGFAAGAAVGYLLNQVFSLRQQLGGLDKRLTHLVRDRKRDMAALAAEQAQGTEGQTPWRKPVPDVTAATARAGLRQPGRETAVVFPEQATDPAQRSASLEKLLAIARRWLTTGNVPVKLGVIVSFFGVGFLLKYAVDKRILVLSIELRLLVVAITAAALLGVGWRLRSKARVYALSLQGGGIGILYLTIFSAFRLYDLLPASAAFVLLVLLTAGAGILAILQEARAMAILGCVGGFLAPVLVSTGSGNHVALFSYYLLLNSAILGIAWYRAWRSLNLIGFGFTFIVGTLWGYEYYRPELFGSTEPFLVLYFLFYQAIAILFAFRQPPDLRGVVDGTIIFGTPVIAFALQAQLVDNTEYGLAVSAASVAAFYLAVATWLRRVYGEPMRLLHESFVALGIAFATIAVPLALDDRWTSAAWALEGAALVWVGVRQQGMLPRLSGCALLLASGVAFMIYGWTPDLGMPVLNGNVLGGLMISMASLFGARALAAEAGPRRWQAPLSVLLMIWGLTWWVGTGAMEITDRAQGATERHYLTGFIALSAALLAWVAKRRDWGAARQASLAYLPALAIIGILYLIQDGHLLVGVGSLAWVLAVIVHFHLLRAYDNGRSRIEAGWHFAGVVSLAAAIAAEVHWRMDQAMFSEVWATSAALFVPALSTLLVILVRDRFAWPLLRYWGAYLTAAAALIVMQLGLVAGFGVDDPGDPAPMRYLPILNPFDALTIVGLIVGLHCLLTFRNTAHWLQASQFRTAAVLWGLAAFLLTTIAVVRGVHHLAAVPWDDRALARSVSVQSALSIYWGVLAFSGMIWGARHSRRWVWLVGTGLMGLVVVKLFVVDLGNTGTVARIISFLGVGALLLVVGYFAPAPPKQSMAPNSATNSALP